MRKYVKLICFILLPFLILHFCGCLNPVSIDSCGYVVAIGADKGEEKKYAVTLELQREASGDNSTPNGGAILLTSEADDLFQAISSFDSRISFTLNFTRTSIFLFGEQLAREGLIPDFLRFSFDVLRIRQSALMLITHCSVREYLGGIAANSGANVSKIQDDIISDVQMTGEIAAINVSKYYEAVDGGWFDAVMPVGYYDASVITDTEQRESTTKGEDPLSDADAKTPAGGMKSTTLGCAVFDGARLAAILGAYDTQFMNIGRGDFVEGTVDCPLPGGRTAALYLKLKSRTIGIAPGSSSHIKAELSFNVTVEYDPSGCIGRNWETGEKQRIEAYLSSRLLEVFEKCRSAGSDAMGFGRSAAKHFKTLREFDSYDWKAAFRNAEAEFIVELILDDEYIADHRQ